MTHRSLRTRSARIGPAAIISVVILVLAALLLWWGIRSLTEGSLTGSAHITAVMQTSAADTIALTIAGATVALGLVLIGTAILPGAKRLSALATTDNDSTAVRTGTSIALTSKGLATLAASAADQIDGVDTVRVAATAGHVRVRITTPVRAHAGIRREVAEAVRARLAELHLTRMPQVRVSAAVKEL